MMSSPKQFITFGRNGGSSNNNIFNLGNIYGPWIAASNGEYAINTDPINA